MDLDGNRLASLATVSLTRTLALEGDEDRGRDNTIPVQQTTPPSASCNPLGDKTIPIAAASDDGSTPVGNAFLFLKKPPMDPSQRLIVGSWFHELKARVQAFESREASCSDAAPCGLEGRVSKGSRLRRLVTSPEGFVVEMEGVVVVAAHGKELGKRLDCLALQCRALAKALSGLPGRFVCVRICMGCFFT